MMGGLIFVLWTLQQQDLPPWTILRLPDTGQTRRYATAEGDDSSVTIHAPKFERNGDGTVTDIVTGLQWQQADGGEMTWDAAVDYCRTLDLGGRGNWRLPFAQELFTIQNHGVINPALDTVTAFTRSAAEYWWSIDKRVDDKTFAWATNAGGGIGAHRLNETRSAGGTKLYHARCVRHDVAGEGLANLYTDNGDGTMTDNRTGLIWQKTEAAAAVDWEAALRMAADGWRVPNIKELRSLQSERFMRPVIDPVAFPGTANAIFWSSTTQIGQQGVTAWTLDFGTGVVSYNNKSDKLHLRLVRGGEGARIAFGGIRNAASLAATGEICAGELLSIVGTQFRSGALKINGAAVDPLAWQEDRIEAVMPSAIAGLETVTVQVEDGPPHVVRVAAAAPGIFTKDGSGTGAAVVESSGSGAVTILATGYGDGSLEIRVDGKLCEVLTVEGPEVGKVRLTFRVPNDAVAGTSLPLDLRIGDRASQPGVTLEIP